MSAPRTPTRRAAHARALATVTRISFTLAGFGLGGCIEHAPGSPDPMAPDDAPDAAADAALVDAAWHTDAEWLDDMGEPDAIDAMAPDALADALIDAGALADAEAIDARVADAEADAVVWSETTPCPSPAEDPEAWQACCEAKNWDFEADPNCAAWGPPMPPRMLA